MPSKHDCIQTIHYELVKNGYERVASGKDEIYCNNIEISGIIFPVKIILVDPFFVEKPVIILQDKPEGLTINVPHLIFDKILCYLDDRGVEFDRYTPLQNIFIVLSALNQLLEQYAKHPELLQEEFRRELPAYWQREYSDSVYLISSETDEMVFEHFERADCEGQILREFVIADSAPSAEFWRERRNGSGKIDFTGRAILIDLPQDISFSLDDWPPKCFSDVVSWLETCGSLSCSQRFIDKTFSVISLDSKCFVVFKLKDMLFGALLTYSSENVKNIIRGSFRVSSVRKRGRKKSVSISAKRKTSLIKSLESYENAKGFKRLSMSDARPTTVHNRNLADATDLSGLKIAVVGCGTVGGYVVSFLFQAGAGSGNGTMELFDADILTTENLGRHYLGVEYLGVNKALALSKEIRQVSGTKIDIVPHKVKIDPADIENLTRKFDLLVDTTGDISFSTSLCHNVHRAKNPIPVFYGWVDAGGLAARALLDEVDPSKACYSCLKDRSPDDKISERFQLFKKGAEIPSWQPRPCGIGGYLPFSTQASVSAAGLVQGLCIGWANGSPSPRFRHLGLDKRVLETKSNDIKPLSNCPCCQTS